MGRPANVPGGACGAAHKSGGPESFVTPISGEASHRNCGVSPYGPNDKIIPVYPCIDGGPYCTLNNFLPVMNHPPCPLMLLHRK